MKVSPVSYSPSIMMKASTTKQKEQNIKEKITSTPIGIGVVAGVGALGIGLGIDRVCSYMFGMSRNIKTSLIVNSLVGAAIGLYTYTQAKSAERELQNS